MSIALFTQWSIVLMPRRPLRAFDDGQHVYIQMPAGLQASEAPALLVQSRGGEPALVNYRVRLPYYVVDRIFDTAVLIVGVGRQQDRVTIRRKPEGRLRRRRTTPSSAGPPGSRRRACRWCGSIAACSTSSGPLSSSWSSGGWLRCAPRARG